MRSVFRLFEDRPSSPCGSRRVARRSDQTPRNLNYPQVHEEKGKYYPPVLGSDEPSTIPCDIGFALFLSVTVCVAMSAGKSNMQRGAGKALAFG